MVAHTDTVKTLCNLIYCKIRGKNTFTFSLYSEEAECARRRKCRPVDDDERKREGKKR